MGDLIAAHYPVTLFLVAYAVALSLPLVLGMAVWSARRQGGAADHAIRLIGVAGVTLPVFWLAILLSRLFGVTLGWFPVSGFGETPVEHVHHLFLPALSTAIWVAPILMRDRRATLLDQMERDYVVVGRSKGLPEGEVFRRHVAPTRCCRP